MPIRLMDEARTAGAGVEGYGGGVGYEDVGLRVWTVDGGGKGGGDGSRA